MLKHDLIEKLRSLEETALLDLLGITSDQLVDAFLDIIEEKENYLNGQVWETDF
jgi:hypothetical protein